MKMDAATFQAIESGIKAVMQAHPDSHARYRAAGLTDRRWRWDLLWRAKSEGRITADLYHDLDDAHIDTALRRITGTK